MVFIIEFGANLTGNDLLENTIIWTLAQSEISQYCAIICYHIYLLAWVVQSDARLTGDLEVAGLNPTWTGNILSW